MSDAAPPRSLPPKMAPSPNRLLLALVTFAQLSLLASAAVFSCSGGAIYFTAHPDDDLLFQSPSLYNDIAGGTKCVTGISLTSGDSGYGSTYAQAREAGNEAAFAEMAGVASNWTQISAVFGGQTLIVRTLVGAPQIQKIWMRLPDGDVDGSGYAVTGYQTLRELYFGSIGSITTQDKSATYTLATLKQALSQIITALAPASIQSLDNLSQYDAGDHSDHLTVGRLTSALKASYAAGASFNGYMGYPSSNIAPNIATTSSDFTHKTNAFFAYTPYDSGECQSWSACVSAGRGEANWMLRSYPVNSSTATNSYIGTAQSESTLPAGVNVATLATATASSTWGGNSAYAASSPHCAIDGVIGGYPGNYSAEWVSNGGTAGTWFKLTWDQAQNVTGFVLYDRENTGDWIIGGTMTWSDGTVQAVSALENDGSMTVFDVPGGAKSTTSLLFTVTSVYTGTSNVGLGEFQVFAPSANSGNAAAATNATTTATTATVLSTVNLALNATATASTEASGQPASDVNDGIVGGYSDGDDDEEWSSDHQGAGAWVLLTWPSEVNVSEVILYDRPNSDDQVLSGTLTFDDGTAVTVGALANDGSATAVNFTTRATSTLLFTVDSVSSTTSNVGLAEMQVFGPVLSTKTNSSSSTSVPTSFSTVNIALNATATASSGSTDQGAANAIDGIVGGYSDGSYTQEWASNHEGAGAWITLTWTTAKSVAEVILYDRPNSADQITSGTLSFSDGSTVAVGSLNNDGSATGVTFATRNVTYVTFTVGTVSSTTSSAGLAEFQVYGPAGSNTASNTTTSSSNSTATYTYSSVDVALNATAAASSAATGQGASAAIDGVIGGYSSGVYTEEWASDHEGAGAWISLTWGSAVNLAKAVLYDRPNSADQITGGTLSFSDGSSVTVGSLNNDGSATTVTFAPRNVTTAKFTVTSVSSSTSSAGLAEFQLYGISGSVLSYSNSSANATASTNSTSSASNVVLSTVDLALNATATASSASTGQGASAAIDGVVGGYSSGSYTQEWASSGQGAGAWILLTWPSTLTVAEVILYDRPNTNDQVTSGTLSFSDGSSIAVSSLENAGGANTYKFSPKNVTTVKFTVNTVSSTTSNVGLAEIQVYGPASNATGTATNSTTSANSTSAANSTIPTSFSTIDVALNATASASSAGSGQGASSAIDGIIGGYSNGLYTQEWASNGQGVGAWLLLNWNYTVNVAEAILYDRPNSNDQVTGGTLSFSDGSSVTVGSLNNDGSATTVKFAARNVTSAKFTVTSVSSTTGNVGLSEIQLYGAAGTNTNAGAKNVTASAAVTSAVNTSATATSGLSSVVKGTGAISASSNATLTPTSTSALPTGKFNATASLSSGFTASANATGTASANLTAAVTGSYSTLPITSGSSTYSTVSFSSSALANRTGSAATGLSATAANATASAATAVSSKAVTSSALPTSSVIPSSVVVSSKVGTSSSVPTSAVVKTSSVVPTSAVAPTVVKVISTSVVKTSSIIPTTTSKALTSSAAKTSATMLTLVRSTATTAATSALSTAPAQATNVNIAALGKAYASSSSSASPASGANDGVIGGVGLLGIGGDAGDEWVATTGDNAWVQVNLTANYMMKEVVLYGRINTLATIVSEGTLTFSDGTTVDTGAILTTGTTVVLGTAGVTASWVRFTATRVTGVAGLAEMQFYNYAPSTASCTIKVLGFCIL